MQGEVYVPYTGIGGTNMNSGIMTLDIGGSTNPGMENQSGTTVNARWVFPGGIINKGTEGKIGWGYALVPKEQCNDSEVRAWLTGKKVATRALVASSYSYNDNDIDSGNAQIQMEIEKNITAMLQQYVHDVLLAGDYNSFREYYEGCVYLV